jgi:dTDP-glucose 4,6-dehydratase
MSAGTHILVTGGLGFIGSCFVEMALRRGYIVTNVDKMTYASRTDTQFHTNPHYTLIQKDIADLETLPPSITYIVNFAAESHVDNSIKSTDAFLKSNVQGVHNLLELVRKTPTDERPVFIQISTDEVYGDILEGSFIEHDRLKPSNPYSATKAAAEELVIGWGRTYGLRYRITRASNNYGTGQNEEKFIPRIMKLARHNEKAKIYGNGLQKREWTHTSDHCEGIFLVMEKGADSEIYNISTSEELTNLEIAEKVLRAVGKPADFYELVTDRPGHDVRYSITCDKIRALGWKPNVTLEQYLSTIS